MKVLAFAHVTFCVRFSENYSQKHGNLEVREMVSNHPEKAKLQKRHYSSHQLSLYRDDGLAVEMCSYPETNSGILGALRSSTSQFGVIKRPRIIRSKSFTPSFLRKMGEFSKTPVDKDKIQLELPALDPRKTVVLAGSRVAPKFKDKLDELGPVALAFWVDSLEGFNVGSSQVFEYFQPITSVFSVAVNGRQMKVAFARVEGVNIELLCR